MAVPAAMAPHLALMLVLISSASAAATVTKGVSLRFPRFGSPALNCSIDGSAGFDPANVCLLTDGGSSVIVGTPDVISARYQYSKKVRLWSSKLKTHAASFATSYVIEFRRSGDRRETENYFSFGGGWAFAITPDQNVGKSGPESLGLFEINEKTGDSLRGKKTKTVAVELDISRGSSGVSFSDPGIPHIGLDVNSVRSKVTAPIGNFTTLVDRPIAVWVDYDASAAKVEVRVQKLSGSPASRSSPDKSKSKLYISYAPLRLSEIVSEESYVGFSTRTPQEDNGNYVLTAWSFATTWVPLV